MRKRKGYFKDARVPQRSGVAGLVNVPRLEELLADPEQIGVLDAQTTRVLKTQAISVLLLLNSLDLDTACVRSEAKTERGDRLLNVIQAAEKLCAKPDWLYRHRELPFRVRQGRALRFSELGIEDYIRKRRGG
jgi:hypothetical protein